MSLFIYWKVIDINNLKLNLVVNL